MSILTLSMIVIAYRMAPINGHFMSIGMWKSGRRNFQLRPFQNSIFIFFPTYEYCMEEEARSMKTRLRLLSMTSESQSQWLRRDALTVSRTVEWIPESHFQNMLFQVEMVQCSPWSIPLPLWKDQRVHQSLCTLGREDVWRQCNSRFERLRPISRNKN